jgi:plastocyanin
MKHIMNIPFLALGFLLLIGISFDEINAQLAPNQANLVEGSGFAVTEQSIKISQIDLLMSTASQTGSSIRVNVEDGFVTMDDIDFIVEDITGSILREGRFIRLVGTAESSIGSQVTVSLFGKLVQNTNEGSIYSFTGKLTQGAESNKIIYTTKISTLGESIFTSPSSQTSSSNSQQNQKNIIEVRISRGAANPADFNYISQGYVLQKEFLIPDRISTIPGVTLKFTNEDTVSHNISSGHRDTTSSGGSPNIADGRLSTGEILPGQSKNILIEQIGFYSLFDVDYPWMTMDVVVFPDVDSDIIRRSTTNPIN